MKLPTWLPDNCKPVAVWYKLPLVAIIAYDNRSISNYDEARITVEIALMRRDITKAKLLKSLQRWIEELRSRGRDAILIQLNGTYIVLVKNLWDLHIAYIYDLDGNLEYTVTVKSQYSFTYLIKIIESMKPIDDT